MRQINFQALLPCHMILIVLTMRLIFHYHLLVTCCCFIIVKFSMLLFNHNEGKLMDVYIQFLQKYLWSILIKFLYLYLEYQFSLEMFKEQRMGIYLITQWYQNLLSSCEIAPHYLHVFIKFREELTNYSSYEHKVKQKET